MKNIKELNDKKIPIVRIDSSLEKYLHMPLFQEKVEKANEALRTIGLPKLLKKQHFANRRLSKSWAKKYAFNQQQNIG